ncbi:MAG: hypothetical protein EOO04_14970 [Chitinophagaceae bacterium]|nr:MAG: hypothetical protein EOO04_14970 [Chitinophagaceae bacterium]
MKNNMDSLSFQSGRWASVFAIMVAFVLFNVESCGDAPSKTDRFSGKGYSSNRLIDSLILISKQGFDSVARDPTRKDIFLRMQDVTRQVYGLTQTSQYKIDTVAKIIEKEALILMQMGDTIMANDRMLYARNIYRSSDNKTAIAKTYLTGIALYRMTEKDSATIISFLDSAQHIALAAHDTMTYFNAVLKKAENISIITNPDFVEYLD